MSILIPTHLAGHVEPIEKELDIERGFALRSAQGGDRFELRYTGEFLDEHGLIADLEGPGLVIARAVDTGEEIVLFDAAAHGYNAMFVEEYDADELAERRADQLLELDGQTQFAVEVSVIDNIDWDEDGEEDELRDEDGVLRLITGDEITPERLRADGFDALGIDVLTADGTRYNVVSEELA